MSFRQVRAVYFGTPEIAVPALRALAEIAEIVGVVCQPDRPAGRGMRLREPAVKLAAKELGCEVLQPLKLKDGQVQDWLEQREVDVALVMAYGRILPPGVLVAPRVGCVNLHASLLPLYRGAAPIQRAIMDGATETGVCLMQMDEQMDTGNVISCRSTRIEEQDDAGSVSERLARLAAELTRDDLPRFVRGELETTRQDHERATYAPPIEQRDALLDPARPAREVADQVRGLSPRPGVTALLLRPPDMEKRFRILRARATSGTDLKPGELSLADGKITVGTGEGSLEVLEGQLEGKKVLAAKDLVNGRLIRQADRLVRPQERSRPA